MGKPRRPFDIRSLFGQSTAPEDAREEDMAYDAIESKRSRKTSQTERVFSSEDMAVLGRVTIEEPVATAPHAASRSGEADVSDTSDNESCDNREWKIHVLRGHVLKNPLNVDARIKLSRVLGGAEGARVLLEARDTRDAALWKEIVGRCYSPDMLGSALEVADGDEEFYISLFLRDGSPVVLRAGIERHPTSIGLRRMLADSLTDPCERQLFLYESAAETGSEEVVAMFLGTSPGSEAATRLYGVLKSRGMYSDGLLAYMVGNGLEDAAMADVGAVGLGKMLRAVRAAGKVLDIPAHALTKKDVLGYVRDADRAPMDLLPTDLRSLCISMSRAGLHDDETFLSCYGVARMHVLDTPFIDAFFVMAPRRYFVDLMKARELWRLFVLTRDIGCFRRAERILRAGEQRYTKQRKMFVLARAKMHYVAGDYHGSYLAIPKRMRTIRRYVVLAQISLTRAISELGNDLFDYKHWLLYAELVERSGADACGVYERCMERHPENAKVGIGYLRYLKRRDLERALEMSRKLVERFPTEEWVWFERFVVSRKLGQVALPVLYNSRRHVRSELIESEIRHYENKRVDVEGRYAGYSAYKRMRLRECNAGGVCGRCAEQMKAYYRERILRSPDDGDEYLLYHCVGGADAELKRMAEFFDPRAGHYWARVRNIGDLWGRFAAGSGMIDFDLL